MILDKKLFVVTGAGNGIGSELAKSLLKRGAKVAAVDLSTESLKQLKSELKDSNLTTFTVNITDREAVNQLPEQIVAQSGPIDGLINCAGIIQPFVKVNDLDFAAAEKVMNVNFYGTLNMVKAFLPGLLKRPEAYIANVSSMGGFLPVPGQSIYGASKAAVKLLTEGLRAELLNTNVKVSVIFPGATKTNITQNSGVATPVQAEASASDQGKDFPMITAEKAAEIVVAGLEKNKPQIFTGNDSNLLNILYRLSPVRATNFIASKMQSLLEK